MLEFQVNTKKVFTILSGVTTDGEEGAEDIGTGTATVCNEDRQVSVEALSC
jgi:hypothetical protein